MTADQIKESIQSLQDYKAKVQTPILVKNAERSIQILTKQLHEIEPQSTEAQKSGSINPLVEQSGVTF